MHGPPTSLSILRVHMLAPCPQPQDQDWAVMRKRPLWARTGHSEHRDSCWDLRLDSMGTTGNKEHIRCNGKQPS